MNGKMVHLGKCPTCRKRVYGYINEHAFEAYGLDHPTDVIRVEGHCGTPGHNILAHNVTKREFDAAKDGETI